MSKTNYDRVYLNGQWLNAADASISVFDRGFLFGDGIYEVLPVYGQNFLRLTEHLERLENSLQLVKISNPMSQSQWRGMLKQLLAENKAQNCSVYLQITRGSTGARDHAIPNAITPTVFACVSPLPSTPQSVLDAGVSAITTSDIRWHWCHVKAITLLANVLLKEEGNQQGCNETLLIRDGLISEGASSNVFAVINNQLVTPPKSPKLLPGITRDLTLEIAHKTLHLSVIEADITEAELRQAEEIFITSSTRELYPVTQLDGQAVGNGKPGAVWKQLHQSYQDYKHKLGA